MASRHRLFQFSPPTTTTTMSYILHTRACVDPAQTKRGPGGDVEFEAMGTGGRGRSHTPLGIFTVGGKLLCASLGMKSRRSQGPLQLRVPHLSSRHGDSSCLQAHERLCASESPLSTCNMGLVRGELPQRERQTAMQMDSAIAVLPPDPLLASRGRALRV